MSGVKYLLDTNVILGMLKSTPEILAMVGSTGLLAQQCAFSAVTRMELLGYPGITADEDALIRQRLAQLTYHGGCRSALWSSRSMCGIGPDTAGSQ